MRSTPNFVIGLTYSEYPIKANASKGIRDAQGVHPLTHAIGEQLAQAHGEDAENEGP